MATKEATDLTPYGDRVCVGDVLVGSGTGAAAGDDSAENALFAAIRARKAKQEARMAAIEAGEITVEDPREKRERLLKEEERKKRAEANAKRK